MHSAALEILTHENKSCSPGLKFCILPSQPPYLTLGHSTPSVGLCQNVLIWRQLLAALNVTCLNQIHALTAVCLQIFVEWIARQQFSKCHNSHNCLLSMSFCCSRYKRMFSVDSKGKGPLVLHQTNIPGKQPKCCYKNNPPPQKKILGILQVHMGKRNVFYRHIEIHNS